MKRYYLFLDESKPTGDINHFCLGGCIIEENIYENTIVPYINGLKNNVFSTTEVILHEMDIREAKKEPYLVLRKQEKRKEFWDGLQELFSSDKFSVIGTIINCQEYSKIYNSKYSNEEYFVAMQIILENFTHFLVNNDGKGSVYIESRNITDDNKLTNLYHTIVANGTLFLHKLSFQKKLMNVNFLIKVDNNIGLQLADFVPNPINRYFSGLKQKKPSLYALIEKRLYDGDVGLKNRFGLKLIP